MRHWSHPGSSLWKTLRWAAALAWVSMMLGAGCDELPANFWADKWGELINRSIFGVINAVLGAVTGGTIQI